MYREICHVTHYTPTCIALPFSSLARDVHVHLNKLAECHVSRARLVTEIITRHIALNTVSVCCDCAIQGLCDVITIILAKFSADLHKNLRLNVLDRQIEADIVSEGRDPYFAVLLLKIATQSCHISFFSYFCLKS